MEKLDIRPLSEHDILDIVNYWESATDHDFERMGVDPAKLSSPAAFKNSLEKNLNIPASSLHTYSLIWLIDGKGVGHSSLKNISYGKTADMHLHIWNSSMRGKGFGGILFCLSALKFYDLFDLEKIVCEPKATNPMPNRMLQKVGFPLIKTFTGASSELSAVCELNSYLIERTVAEDYLKRHHRMVDF